MIFIPDKNIRVLFFLSIPAFLFFPFLTLVGIIIYFLLFKVSRPLYFYVLFALLALYIGAVNTTKVPESDLGVYYDSFRAVAFYSLPDYLQSDYANKGKEPVYYIFNYLIYQFSGGNFVFFVWLFTVTGYLFLFGAVYKFYRKIHGDSLSILLAVCILAFFNQYFNLTAHLVRQVLALSILMYYIVEKVFYHKNHYVLLVSAILIHSSVLFFVPLLFLPLLKKRLSLKKLIQLVAVLGVFIFLGNKLLISFIGHLPLPPAIGAVLGQLASLKPGDEAGISQTLIWLISLPLFGILVYKLYIRKQYRKEEVYFYNLYICLMFFVLGMSGFPLLQYRFFYMTYAFLPFILPQAFLPLKAGYRYIGKSILLFFFIGRFLLTYSEEVFQYAPIGDILTHDYVSLLITRYW